MRARLFVAALASGAGIVIVTPSGAQAVVRISIAASPGIIHYLRPAPSADTISGRLSSGKRGVRVTLQAKQWPFKGPFKNVAHTRTGRRGAYHFTVRPQLATRYRVVTGRTRSATRTVYVTNGYENFTCTISGKGQTYACSSATAPRAGKYTLREGFDRRYPASVFSTAVARPVYVYYGQRNGSTQPPSTLSLQGTVSQRPLSATAAHISVSVRITIPSGHWSGQLATCTQTQEQRDGFDEPGAPGSRHCGASTIAFSEIPTLG